MKEWFTIPELAAAKLPELPASARRLHDHAARYGWESDTSKFRRADRRGGGTEYHISLLPKLAQAKLAFVHTSVDNSSLETRSKMLWKRFEALSSDQMAVAEERLSILVEAETLRAAGVKMTDILARLAELGAPKSTFYRWRETVEGLPRADWLAALAPEPGSNEGAKAECHPRAWEILKSDFLRNSQPKFSACYRRMMKIAKRDGLEPIPDERTLRRHMDAEVGKGVMMLKRKGKDAARTLHPAQRRSRAHLSAMEMVNMDGHKLDVFVRVPWSKKPVRMILLGIQDLFSGKIVAWRLTEAETWEAVRLCIGDMVEFFGIPESIYFDNGKAFSSKWITGEARKRFRFKVKEEDPRGLVKSLGMEAHFTRPYAGQSKPIERAWGDLAENISKHPFCEGAYTGNRPDAKPENYMSRAIELEEFRAHVAAQIIEHNAQEGRRAENCKGRSFDETFAASMADSSNHVRTPTTAQASLWLLASEAIKARPGSGEVHYQGNRYWSRELNQWAGKQVVIRFDPDALHKPVKVYDLKNRLICEAKCIDNAGFDNIDDARMHARAVKNHLKAVAQAADTHATLSAQQLAEIYYKGTKPPEQTKPEPVRPAIPRLVTGNLATVPAETISEEDFNDGISKAMAQIMGGADILEFPKGNAAAK